MLFNRLGILRKEIDEIILAEHFAKNGIVNSNLLDKEDINQLVSRMKTLPYENTIQAKHRICYTYNAHQRQDTPVHNLNAKNWTYRIQSHTNKTHNKRK